jgi:putative transposase
MTAVVEARSAGLPLAPACRALGLNRSSVYARRDTPEVPEDVVAARRSRRRSAQPRALTSEERNAVRETLYSPEYRDQPPAEVYAALLEEGRYLGSLSTFHRILRADAAQGERRQQRPAQHHAIPRLCATGPNEVWTWDITKLATVHRGVYLSLYVVLDLYSRYAVAWMVSRKENSALAQQLMQEAVDRYRTAFTHLTVHQDRGAPMTARSYLDLLAEFGVTCSHSRPRVSNDNPTSEAQFKTLKYQPDYPGRFKNVEHARRWCEDYFAWYNHQHHHSGLGFYSPTQVFTGQWREIAKVRQATLDAQYQRHPERFVKGLPRAAVPPSAVFINPVELGEVGDSNTHLVNFPTLPAAREAMERYL